MYKLGTPHKNNAYDRHPLNRTPPKFTVLYSKENFVSLRTVCSNSQSSKPNFCHTLGSIWLKIGGCEKVSVWEENIFLGGNLTVNRSTQRGVYFNSISIMEINYNRLFVF
jgi:hypothetical protein